MKFFSEEINESIRAAALRSDQDGYISESVLDIMYQHQLFKLFVPEQFGGAMTSLPRAIRIFEDASYIDGSFGWMVTIGAGGGYFCSYFEPNTAQRLYSPPNAVVAGSGYPSGTARRVDGGYRVSGTWRYCSGADYASMFTANALIDGVAGQLMSFVFTSDQVRINPDWDTFGLKATTGHTIQVDDAFVPYDMIFDLTSVGYLPDAIYRYPFLQFAETSFAAVCIGICKHFLDEAQTAAPFRDSQERTAQDRYAAVNKVIASQREALKKAVEEYHEAVELSWEALILSGEIPASLLADVSRSAKNAVSVSLRCAQEAYPYLGLRAARESTLLNKCWRDLHTASQHILLKSFDEVR